LTSSALCALKVSGCDRARSVGVRSAEGLQVELLVERGDLALCGGHEEFRGQGHEDAVVSGGMIADSLAEFSRHQAVGIGDQVLEAGDQFLACGRLGWPGAC